jgi:CheY-like chemotaxis protein
MQPVAVFPAPSPRRVLVVDDHVTAAELFGEWLTLEGFEARCVHDGAQALACWAVWPAQVVVIDSRLPDIPGGELARQLRLQPGGVSARLIAVSGDDPRQVAETGPFDACLAKPADLRRLLALLQPDAGEVGEVRS